MKTDLPAPVPATGWSAPVGSGAVVDPGSPAVDSRTRQRVARLLLERGPATAAELGVQLGLSPAAIRRHLDALIAAGAVAAWEGARRGPRGRGRPAREFALTETGRDEIQPHMYGDLATAALRWIDANNGAEAVAAFAAAQVAGLEQRCREALSSADGDMMDRAEALARALTAEGYAASASAITSGGQLCQHQCPVAHVAAEFPQLCEAETAVISRLIGTHVQRLATIAHGDGVCTTHIPAPGPVGRRSEEHTVRTT
ncbi:helix-turn-helix transcriptional regulator [Pilimelia columellifera]|uniref:Transcriptional regulator n=1 Tax=Pilimelia columellifera subsp. columellifera TaxID=706583 RepID=A0ABP6AIP3_9ACTN